MTLDAALLDLHAAIGRILPRRPRRQQEAIRRALQEVLAAARTNTETADPREQLQAALERAADRLGWSEVTVIVNASARRLAGPPRRVSE